MNSYITIKQVQAGLYQAYLVGNSRPVMETTDTVLHSFNSRKEARDYIEKNWNHLKHAN